MPNIPVKSIAKGTLKIAKEFLGKEVVEKAVEVGTSALEKYNNRIMVSDLKDVSIEDAVRNLSEMNLLPITAIAKPNASYAYSTENTVVSSEPTFGKKVDPKSSVKLYYVTSEIITLSKELEKSNAEEFIIPRIIGLDMYEAREDLEELGLRVTFKLDKPHIKHTSREIGQVTKVTYPDNKKLTTKQKKGERLWVYYVDENVINYSAELNNNRIRLLNERKNNVVKKIENVSKVLKKKNSH
jgi:hypothetical protein